MGKKQLYINAVTCDIILGNRGPAEICIYPVMRYLIVSNHWDSTGT